MSDVVRMPANTKSFDLEAERAVLAAFLADPRETWSAIGETFTPEAFHLVAHQNIADVIAERCRRGEPVDPILVRGALQQSHREGGDVVLQVTRAYTAGNTGAYWAQVQRLAELRQDGSSADPTGARAKIRAAAHRFTPAQLREDPPPLEYILHPYVPARKVVTLAGPGGSNKTTLLTYLAVARALGLPFYGRAAPMRGKTVILTTEDGVDDYWRRLAAIRHDLGDQFDEDAVADAITVFDFAGEDIRLIDADHGLFTVSPFVEHFAAALRERAPGADLVICETVSRLTCGIETNESLTVLVRAAERVCKLAGVSMLLVSHVSQEAGRLGLADQYAARGGSALGDNGRSTMVLTRINDKNRKEYLPDAELTRKQMQDLLVLTHPKSIGPKADELILERHSTPHGPVLAPAVVTPREEKRGEKRKKLCALVADLARNGQAITPRELEDYNGDLDCSQKEIRKLVREALKHNELASRRNPHGRGLVLVPTRDPGAAGAAPDPAAPAAPASGDLFEGAKGAA